MLATAAGKTVVFWDVNACSMKQTLMHEGTVNALHLNTEGSLLATCGNDRKVTTWSLPRGDRVPGRHRLLSRLQSEAGDLLEPRHRPPSFSSGTQRRCDAMRSILQSLGLGLAS